MEPCRNRAFVLAANAQVYVWSVEHACGTCDRCLRGSEANGRIFFSFLKMLGFLFHKFLLLSAFQTSRTLSCIFARISVMDSMHPAIYQSHSSCQNKPVRQHLAIVHFDYHNLNLACKCHQFTRRKIVKQPKQ